MGHRKGRRCGDRRGRSRWPGRLRAEKPRTQPIGVIEAKRFAIDPYSAKDQAKAYADTAAPFVLLSNGHEHYFWDYAEAMPEPSRLALAARP